MTPTLMGRIQTRLFVIGTAALLWTLLLTPLLPVGFLPLRAAYQTTLTALALTAGLGVLLWEPVYHLLQQFRWEKDWPAILVFLQGVPEGVLVWFVMRNFLDAEISPRPFIIHFASTWLVVFVCVHGPLRVPSLRWRFRGGRLI